jgi:hypothetical protein
MMEIIGGSSIQERRSLVRRVSSWATSEAASMLQTESKRSGHWTRRGIGSWRIFVEYCQSAWSASVSDKATEAGCNWSSISGTTPEPTSATGCALIATTPTAKNYPRCRRTLGRRGNVLRLGPKNVPDERGLVAPPCHSASRVPNATRGVAFASSNAAPRERIPPATPCAVGQGADMPLLFS